MFYYIEEKKHCLFLDILDVLLVHVICPLHDNFKDWKFLPQGGYYSFEFKNQKRITKVDTHAQGGVIINVFARFFNSHNHVFNLNKKLKPDKFPPPPAHTRHFVLFSKPGSALPTVKVFKKCCAATQSTVPPPILEAAAYPAQYPLSSKLSQPDFVEMISPTRLLHT